MRQIIVITFFIIVAFVTEFLLFNMVGRWVVPDLLLLLVIFFNLYFGIRYGLFAAVLAGAVTDSFGTGLFGIHLCSLMICACLTTILKGYIYHMGSRLSRYILISLIAVINVIVCYGLYETFGNSVSPGQVLKWILPTQVLVTLAVAPLTFRYLKQCVSGLFA